MEKIKTILDRKPLNSEYINSKQDFGKVMDGFQKLKPPVYKKGWFYGAVGLATVAVVLTATSITTPDSNEEPQLATTNAATSIHIEKGSVDPESHVLAPVNNTVQDEPVGTEPVVTPSEPDPIPSPVVGPDAGRVMAEVDTVETKPEVVVEAPNIAGFKDESIPFEDFCDPMGIQVNDDIVIVGYTIHYSSCTREVTAQIRGSKIPSQVCNEISGCGERIEIQFSSIKGYSKSSGEPVPLSGFTLVPNV